MKLSSAPKLIDQASPVLLFMSLGFWCFGKNAYHRQLSLNLATLYAAYVVLTVVYNLQWHPLASFPGPSLRAAFHFPQAYGGLAGTPFLDVKSLHDRYGSVVRISPNTLSYNNAQAWKDIYRLRSDRTELEKDPFVYRRRTTVHILNSRTQEHNRHRKLLAPGFTDAALAEQESLLNIYFDLLVSKLKGQIDGPAHGKVDMVAYYNFITFDIIGDLVLGEPFGALEGEVYHQWMRNGFEAVKLLGVIRFAVTYPVVGILLYLCTLLSPSLAAKLKLHVAFTRDRVQARLSRITERKDIIGNILRYNSKTEHAPLSEKEIRSNSRILLTAGSDTTATNLSGTTWLLLTHPEILQRVQTEVRTAFQTAEDITLKGVSDEKRLPYLNAVIQEVLRFYPSLPGTLPRVTGPGGAMIDGKFVPANTSVGVHQWSAYRSKENFALPDKFCPERWLSTERDAIFETDDREALQPFTLGPRVCLGKSLAYAEIRSVLTRMLWHFDMSLERESANWIDQKEYMLWDKPPLWVTLRHRNPV